MKDKKSVSKFDFSAFLAKQLEGRKISHVAKELGIPKSLLHDWTLSRRKPSFDNIPHLKKLANYLGISLETLLIGYSAEDKHLSSITFSDDDRNYRVRIERID